MQWQVNDLAVCMVGIWFDADGFPLTGFPASGPNLGQMLPVTGMRLHPEYGSLDLAFKDWPDAWFDAAGFRRIPPPVKRHLRKISITR
jgi:hypothetical protein